MADQNTPNPQSNKDKAEGERWSPEQQGATDTAGETGGITNRPLDEEEANQEAVPERGHKKDESEGRAERLREGTDQ